MAVVCRVIIVKEVDTNWAIFSCSAGDVFDSLLAGQLTHDANSKWRLRTLKSLFRPVDKFGEIIEKSQLDVVFPWNTIGKYLTGNH